MPIQIRCDQCHSLLEAPDDSQGKKARCNCGAFVAIPEYVAAQRIRSKNRKVTVECAGCHKRMRLSEEFAGCKLRCHCGAYIQIEALPKKKKRRKSTVSNDAKLGAEPEATPVRPSVYDELTPNDWAPRPVLENEQRSNEERDERVLMSYIIRDRDRKNPSVAFGLMVLFSLINWMFALFYFGSAWFVQSSEERAERFEQAFPDSLQPNEPNSLLWFGFVSLAAGSLVFLPKRFIWWTVAGIFTTSVALRIVWFIAYFAKNGLAESVPRGPLITFVVVAFMTSYFFGADAREYFRVRVSLPLAAMIFGSFLLMVVLISLILWIAGQPNAAAT